MRKTSIALGLGLALSLAGVTAGSQTTSPDSARRPSADARRGPGGPGGAKGGQRGGRRGPEGFLLRGITLTDAQKTQLQLLRDQDKARMEQQRAQFGKQREEMRALREKGDTAAIRRAHEQRRAAMTQERDRRAAAVRNLLTAEQRVTFDKNLADAKAREAQRAERGDRGFGKGRGGKGGGRRGGDRQGR